MRSESVEAPEWDDDDRELALAVEAEIAAQCTGCGAPKDLAWDPSTRGRWETTDPVTCWACRAMDDKTRGAENVHLLHLSPRLRPAADKQALLEDEDF